MQTEETYDQYPAGIVLVATLQSLLTYAIGAFLLGQIHIVFAGLYLLAALALEYRLISRHCTDCYYYDRTCAFGKGRVCGRLFRKGDPQRFSQMAVTWKDILPDFLMFIIPAVAGIALVVTRFSFLLLALTALIFILGFAGNAIVRGKFACRHCRQRETGCPAERLFSKKQGSMPGDREQ